MKAAIRVILVLIGIQIMSVTAFDLSDIFKPQKKKTAQHHYGGKAKKAKRSQPARATPSPSPRPAGGPIPATPSAQSLRLPATRGSNVYFLVDGEWLARYRVYEALWSY